MSELYDVIAEEAAFQKTFSKKKRGRPSLLSRLVKPELHQQSLELLGQNSWRGKQNELYYILSLHRLFPEEYTEGDYRWIESHKTVIYELARVGNNDDARALLQQVRESDMTVRQAVAAIRAWRIGHRPKVSVRGLTNEILRLLSRYTRAHPETTEHDIEQALNWAFNRVAAHHEKKRSSEAEGR